MKIAFAVLGTVALLTIPSQIDTAAAQSVQSASVTQDNFCSAWSGPGGGIYTYDGMAVKAGSGNVSFTCHFDVPDYDIPSSVGHSDGFVCRTPYGSTYDSRFVITPGGQATLTCKINRNHPAIPPDDGSSGT